MKTPRQWLKSRTLKREGRTYRLVWQLFPSCRACAFFSEETECPVGEGGELRCSAGIWRETFLSRLRRFRRIYAEEAAREDHNAQ
jgi:hypothetical protein